MKIIKFIGDLFGWLLLLGLVVLGIAFVCVLCGVHLKRKETKENKWAAIKPDLPQPSEDQKQLEQIDRDIDYTVGAIQANPMSPGKGAYEAELAALQQEKQTRLRRMATHMESVTVQDAWDTFTPEQQKRFDAQVYQYSQDVGRDGVLPREAYAENRGLVFVDHRPVPKEVAARLKELREAAAAEKERKKTMVRALDYPVPFKELIIYPNHTASTGKHAQVLHEDSTGSHGTLYRETVALYDTADHTSVLVCNKQEKSEHGSEYDHEWSVAAYLSMKPGQPHYRPLTRWILSIGCGNLRKYTDRVCVLINDKQPIEYKFNRTLSIAADRYKQIGDKERKTNQNQYGWHREYDDICLAFDGPTAYLFRSSSWTETPSGQEYRVSIELRLLPDVQKKYPHEELRALMDSLPWWNPDSADRLLWNARNWLDEDWLQKQAEFNDSMYKKNPRNDAYEKTLDEVLKQLCLLEGSKPAEEEEEEMKKTLTFMPTTGGDLKGYRMGMHTTSGEKYSFILSGLTAFNPNRSSRCGYGCDDWLFHCTLNGEDYILNFSDEASYGRCWRCVAISREDAENLAQLEAADWLRLMAKSGKQIYHLHPDHAAEARAAMNITASRCGPISDKDFYGL